MVEWWCALRFGGVNVLSQHYGWPVRALDFVAKLADGTNKQASRHHKGYHGLDQGCAS